MRPVSYIYCLILVAACHSGRGPVRWSGTSDFKNFKTYAFIPARNDTIMFNDDVVEFRGIELVKQELDSRGFSLERENPDFFVRVQTFFKNLDQEDDYPVSRLYETQREKSAPGISFYFNGKPAYEQTDISAVGHAEGNIMVEFIDAANGSLLWNGWIDQPIQPNALPEELEEYFGMLFEAFPVKPK